MFKHALRNALIPLVTLLALDLPYIIGGAVFIEMIFSWPGMGLLYYQAALQRDYPGFDGHPDHRRRRHHPLQPAGGCALRLPRSPNSLQLKVCA